MGTIPDHGGVKLTPLEASAMDVLAGQVLDQMALRQSPQAPVAALARAQEFVGPPAEASRPGIGTMTSHAFLDALFRPHADEAGTSRVILTGDDAVCDHQAATSVALLFQEPATNAAKYGALSAEDGHVHLSTRNQDDRFVLRWDERGGLLVVADLPAGALSRRSATLKGG